MCDRVCNQKKKKYEKLLGILIATSDKNTKAKIRAAVYSIVLYAGNALYIVYKQIINKVISIVQ